ncbi:MAG: GNAT family N-acetyltransferase [Phormidesmis sp.]
MSSNVSSTSSDSANLFPSLETDRLRLRQATQKDSQDIFAVFADPKVTEFHDLATFESVDDALKVVERRAKTFASGQGIRWAIELKLNRRIVGSCGFSWHPDSSIKGAEIGYELASNHWRKGIMSEALSAAIRYGFETRELEFVIARVMLDNIASKGLLKKLGFKNKKTIEKGGFWKGQHHDLEQFLLERDNFVDL